MHKQALDRSYRITPALSALRKDRKRLKLASWLTLSVLLMGFPLIASAAEAPGGITILVKDQITDRPLPNVQITITERKTNSTRSVETDAQGRIVIEQLDPGLYSVNVAKAGSLHRMNQAYA
jgi:hypothetical protein